jgi:hypothetical protein
MRTQPTKEPPTLKSLLGIFATDDPPRRYAHVCRRCRIDFTNVVRDCDYCSTKLYVQYETNATNGANNGKNATYTRGQYRTGPHSNG